MRAENGAISLGFSTIVQPAASAGATLQAIWFSGQFHGVISAQTPIGSRTIVVVPLRFSNSKFFEQRRSDRLKWPMTRRRPARSARAAIGAPISSLMAAAMSSMRRL